MSGYDFLEMQRYVLCLNQVPSVLISAPEINGELLQAEVVCKVIGFCHCFVALVCVCKEANVLSVFCMYWPLLLYCLSII